MGIFVAVDVETANSARHSICQIGLAAFSAGTPVWQWSSLVNPEEPFEHTNITIHGIRSQHVQTAPTFPALLEGIRASIANQILACHSRFDFDALNAVAEKYGLAMPESSWVDTCSIARLAWPDLENHKLNTLCAHLGIRLKHHDAASDASACGEVLNRATTKMKLSLPEIMERVGTISAASFSQTKERSEKRYSERIEMAGNLQGPWAGHVLVCTGDLTIGERELATLAARLGCDVEDSVTKKRTTILVTGQRDPSQFNGKPKSAKLLKAEELIESGKQISILTEQEFLSIAASYGVRPSP